MKDNLLSIGVGVISAACLTWGVFVLALAYAQGTTVPMPSPKHIEWHEYPVAGMVLGNPAVRDSLGAVSCIRLPNGALLEIPHLVIGADPESVKVKS